MIPSVISMSNSQETTEIQEENQRLIGEVEYYRSILFADMSPQTASIINALRHAVDVVQDNKRLRSGEELQRMVTMVELLEKENQSLRNALNRK